jgi:hypothetical protein
VTALADTGLVLDLDPDLGAGIDAREWEAARHGCRAHLVRVAAGRWESPLTTLSRRNGAFALVVTAGVLTRESALTDHRSLELLGRGDVLVPPAHPPAPLLSSGDVKLTALSPVTLMVLARSFLRTAARWPSLMVNLQQRLETQRERLAVQGLAMHLPRAEHRVLLMLWLLAQSCGRVTPRGVVLPLEFTHDTLGHLAAARRPTVTLAISALESAGCVIRPDDGLLILTEAAEREVRAITSPRDGAAVGQSIALRGPSPLLEGEPVSPIVD